MHVVEVGLILLLVMLFMLCGGVWISITLAITGFVGLTFFTGTPPGTNLFTSVWGATASWELAALPLFIWMGEILFRTRLSEQLFEGLAPWMNRIPGRLMHINVIGCGIFGAVSGSSAATCATVAKVALPELKRRGYDENLAIGSVATAGTLGLLIPPSIAMVVYAVAADASIIRIFLAGFIPGGILMALFSGYIIIWSLLNPGKVPPPLPPLPLLERIRRTGNLIPVAALIASIMFVLISGWATATECAAYGVLGSLVIAGFSRVLTWANFKESLLSATRVSCMIMFIMAGAAFLKTAMAFTGLPRELSEWVSGLGLSNAGLLAVLCVLYIALGCALDGVSMIVLTAAVVLPMIQKAGFDLVWFGVFVVLLVEIAQITPPVGFNLFVLQNMTGKDSNLIAKAALPFFGMLVLCIVIVSVFPGVVTFLPDLIMGPG